MPATGNETGSWSDQLLRMLQEQRRLLVELTELASGQDELIAGGRTDELLDLLARRQSRVDSVMEQQARLGSMTEDLATRLQAVPPPQRERIRALVAEIDDRLAAVIEIDDRGRRNLEAARHDTFVKITTADTGRAVRSAYQPAPRSDARFADHRG